MPFPLQDTAGHGASPLIPTIFRNFPKCRDATCRVSTRGWDVATFYQPIVPQEVETLRQEASTEGTTGV
jgi:hypothetical protein